MTRIADVSGLGEHRGRRGWVVTVLSLQAVAVAAWLLPASVRIVSWPPSGPGRLALLAPTGRLVWFSALALVAAVTLCTVWNRPRARDASLEGNGGRVSSVIAPLNWLWLWAIPFLPWISDRAPLLLVLGGPLRWLIAAAALCAVVRRCRGRLHAGWWRPRVIPGRRTAFAISLVFNVVFGLYSARTLGVGGDEPHYLVIAQSLIRDGDLAIENNHERGDYREYYGGSLRPDYMRRGIDGRIYSVHAPGLPALLIPAFLVAGARGATVFVALTGALAALSIFDIACLLAGRGVAWVVWAGVSLSVPFLPHAWLIFPEMPGALIVAWCVLWMVQTGRRGWAVRAQRGVADALLPRLHTKIDVFQALFGLALAARAAGVTFVLRPSRAADVAANAADHVAADAADHGAATRARLSAAAAFLVPNAVSGVLWLYSFRVLYGAFNPEAAYGAYVAAYVLASNIPHGLIGLFFDQKFGLLFYAPVYLVAIAGGAVMLRDPALRRLALVLGAVVVVFVGSTARLYMFWGGSSAPARFLVPILPCMVPALAWTLTRVRAPALRGLLAAAIGASVAFAVCAAAWPQSRLFFSDPHGRARVLEAIQGGAPLAESIPTFTDPDWASQIGGLVPWFAAAACGFGAAWLGGRRGASGARAAVRFALVSAGVAVLIAPTPRSADAREAVAARGTLDALWEFDGARHRVFDYARGGRPDPARLRELRTLTVDGGTADGQFRSDPVAIPPGVYDIVVWFNGARPREGRVRALELPDSTVALHDGEISNPTTLRIELPVRARALTVRVDGAAAAGDVAQIDLVPLAVLAPRERPRIAVRTFEPIAGPAHAYVVYTDENVYPEGGVFWTRGTSDTQVFVATAGARRLRVTLSTGPHEGRVRLASPIAQRSETVPANGTVEMVMDLPAGDALIPLTIGSSVTFRPGQVDPASSDMRALGCRVLLALE
ncbi:MAG: hypothetical protein AB7Q29_18115 [Vicinamibacterales bacterium]